jgi:hypothetical protein
LDASTVSPDASGSLPDAEIGQFLVWRLAGCVNRAVGRVTQTAGCIQQSVGCIQRRAGNEVFQGFP